MKHSTFRFNGIFLAVIAAISQLPAAHAAEQEIDKQLGEMVIKSDKPAIPANVPSTTESVTAQQIAESVNSVSSAGALQYVPSVHVRERFIGDVNGGLAMRMYGVNSSAQTIVYADGLLLSNFLNNSCCPGPRWGVVSQHSIDRVDVMYGPFSALYPGNSIGGVVLMTTHMPSKLEAHAQIDVFNERFKLYGTDDNFSGNHLAATVGNKVGDWSFWLSADRLDNHSHPTDFTAATLRKSTEPAVVASGPGRNTTTVTGAYFDQDIANKQRVNTASISADHTVKNDGTLKVAYDFSPSVRATYTFNVWQNTSDKAVESYLRDAAGSTVYGTSTSATNPYRFVRINGQDYSVTAPSVSYSEAEYFMHGLSVKSQTGGTWDWELTASLFDQSKDVTRASSGNSGTTPSTSATAGTITILDGTGWQTLDLRGEWRPGGNRQSEHQVSFGYHNDSYTTKSDQYNLGAGNWQTSNAGALNTNSRGVTSTDAIYLQDAWQIAPAVKLVVGGRAEKWTASDGSNYASGTNVTYQDKTVQAFSPKASLTLLLTDDWSLRSSYGRGVRFPTVNELFKNVGIKTASGGNPTPAEIAAFPAPYNVALTNNPNLKPETAESWEFALERFLPSGLWRTSVFGEERRNALVSQSDVTTLPGFSISSVQNVDRVRTYGVETSLQSRDLLINGLDLSGSIAYIHSRIAENRANPGLENTELPLVPDWRASMLAVYHASDALSYSLGWRYSGRQHSGLANATTGAYPDPNPNTYGGRSSFSVFDAKVLYRVSRQWSASVGVDNITNVKYYTLYPYSQRTIFAGVKFDL
ncbi:TonB-dependent receptor [Dechloromonas sp. HYN0024]|uniref:TonB-dependent receptor n=1 Tax=Dechloromonas sp. HYN0024 TaxID=2231055 RepID=UPI000E44DE73|nr:TonB-dependent receptor [Dechloromonas sp. HYN0024]AXS81257.1 TonB-dependent receptor [Dechloromonas sp. HYN0024]